VRPGCPTSHPRRAARQGPLALAFAERHADEVFVLSALHGLLDIDDEIRPYDFAMHERWKDEQEQWASQVAAALLRTCGRIPLRVIGLAGRAYLDPLVRPGCRSSTGRPALP
jgi:hypothetical protein